MPIVLKLVGFSQDHKSYQIKDKFTGPINLRLLHELFIHWNLTTDDIEKIKFITDSEQIKNQDITTSTIARGISVGDELEYADEVTLGRSILQRVPFENSFKNN